MSNLIFPFNGRLAIIDDQYNEVSPLLSVFNKKGIAFNYYNPQENINDIPEPDDQLVNPPRFVFLDLNLQQGVTDPRAVSTHTFGVLERIVDKKTPYVLIIWSQRIKDFAEELIKVLKKNNEIYPLTIIQLTKNNYIDVFSGELADGENSLQQLSDDIASQMDKSISTKLLLEWEQNIHKSSNKIIGITTDLAEKSEDNAQAILYKMASSHLGKNIDPENSNEIAKSACFVLNDVFDDIVEKKFNDFDFTDKITSGMVEANTIAQINTSLLCSPDYHNDYPGSVFKFKIKTLNFYHDFFQKDEDWVESHIDLKKVASILKKSKNISYDLQSKRGEEKTQLETQIKTEVESEIANIKSDAVGVEVIVTPPCDFAQNKRLITRVVYGVMFQNLSSEILKEESIIPKNDYSIKIPTLFIDGSSTLIILDSRFFSGKPKKHFKNKKFVCRFRHQLLVDIQTKIASHVSRLGINSYGH